MGGLIGKVKQAGAVAGGAVAAYKATVTVTGQPVRNRLAPAAIKIAGFTVFERDAELDRTWFGVWGRGKSRVAREHLAAVQAAAERNERGGDGR